MGAKRLDIGKEKLEELYRLRSCREIAEMYGVNPEAIRKKLIKHGIPRRSVGGKREFNPPAKELRKLYQKHSMKEISRLYDVGETVVWKRLKEHGIKLRNFEDGGHRKKPGRDFSQEHRENLSVAHLSRNATGSRNPNWKGGATIRNFELRSSPEYNQWRKTVLKRADNSCEECGIKKGTMCECCGHRTTLHVHHIKSFAKHPKLRFDVTNAEVLCQKCHWQRHGRITA